MTTANATTIGTQTQTTDMIFDGVFERSHDFRIQMPFEDACHFIRRIGEYNAFEAFSVIEALEEIDRLIPRRFYGKDNPNNGSRQYDLSIGREGSPVLYLTFHEWGWRGQEFLDEHTLRLIKQEMELTGRADEADYELEHFGSNRKVTFRFWWD